MATLINQNGTNAADILTYDKGGNGVVYHTLAGSDKVTIKGDSINLVNESGNDIIDITGGSGHNITGSTNNETLNLNGGDAVTAKLDSGRDIINIVNSNGKNGSVLSAIRGGAWTDTFTTEDGAQNYQLYGDEGNDIFNIKGGYALVCWGGAASDTFNVTGGRSIRLRGGDSADIYNISADKVDMQLGYGNDVVNVTAGNNHTIKANLGVNEINLKAGVGHIITADIDQTASKKAGKDVGYGVDNVKISGTASQVTANLGDGKDTVSVSGGSGHKIYTEGWGDTLNLMGYVKNSTFDTGSGNDTINISGGTGNTIFASEGNDTINITGGNNTVINGGDGKDTFVVSGGKNITVVGGLGIDIFEFKNFKANNSYILDLSNDPKGDKETISVEGNSTDYYVKSLGNDVVLTNDEGGSLTIKGWSNQSCAKITFGDNSVYSKEKLLTSVPKVVINSQADVLKYFLTAMDLSTETGFALVDEAVNYASMGQYKNLEELVEEFKYACINYSTPDTYNDFLKEYCSMDLTNEDTGAITGADAGGAEVKTSKTVTGIPAGMKWSDLTYDNSKIIMAYDWDSAELDQFYAVKVNDFTLYWDEENWKSLKVDTEVLEQIIAGVTGIWGEKSIYLSGISYGMDFDDPYCYLPSLPDGSKGIQVILTNEDSDAMAYVQAETITSGELKGASLEKLCINTKYYNKLLPDINGSSEESGLGLDRLIAHEMVHGVMFANIEGMGTMPVFIQEGLAEVVHGIDDYRTENIQVLVDSSLRRNFEDEQGHITYKDQEDTLNDVFDMKDVSRNEGGYSYAGGYTLLRYFAKQVYDKATSASAEAAGEASRVSSDYSNLMAAATSFAEAGALENAIGYEALSTEDKLKITGNC